MIETMKILLNAINAKYIHSNLAVYSLRAYAKEYREHIRLLEYTINNRVEEILEGIYKERADVICFSCYIWNIAYVKELIEELKKLCPNTPIWVGGPEVSYEVETLLAENPGIDGVFIGEGEHTFKKVCRCYIEAEESEREEELLRVPGIAYRKRDKTIAFTGMAEPVDMSTIPFCYEDMEQFKNKIIYYESSRGCPFSCSYCLSSVDKKVRFRSMALVENELQFFLDMKVPQVKFVDRTFNCNHEHTMAIWKYIYEHDNGVTNFHFELSADLLTDEEIEYVKNFRPGLVQFEIGVQTANSETLKAIHRNPDLTVLKQKVAKIRKQRNIHQHLDLIVGLPYEDYDSFKNSYNVVYEMKPDQLQLGFLKVLKGSPIYYDREKFAIVYQDRAPYEVLFTDWVSYMDVLKLKRVEDMTERYYNSMQFEASLPYIISFFDTPFDFFMQIGNFYKKMGYEGIHQSRLQNYEILLEFVLDICKPDKRKEEVLRQLIIYDIYARENLKNRPIFVGYESEIPKDEVRTFYKKEESEHKYLKGYDGNDWKQLHRMTHLEQFDIDIQDYLKTGIINDKKSRLLFDYKNRNPLDHQASIYKIAFSH